MSKVLGQKTDWWKKPFQQGVYPLESIASDWKDRTATEIESLIQILNLPVGSSILDVGCGVGRHSIELAGKGYQVTGTDISQAYLKSAKISARKKNVSPSFICCDMRKIPYRKKYDGVINLFSSFGYFKRTADDRKVLEGLFRALVPGGIFVIDIVNFDWLKKNFTHQSWSQFSDGTLILEQRKKPDSRTNIIKTDWLFISSAGKRSSMQSSIRVYTRENFIQLLKQVGFKVIRTHPPLSGMKVKRLRDSPRLVISAKKL